MPTLCELQAMFRHAMFGAEVPPWEDAVGFRVLAPPVYAFRVALATGHRLDMAAEAALAADADFNVVGALDDLVADGSVRGWRRSHATRESKSCNHLENLR